MVGRGTAVADLGVPLSRFAMRLFTLLAGLALLAAPARAQWVQLDGPKPPQAFALGRAGTTTLLGTDEADQGGVWTSANDGGRWANARLQHGGAGVIHTDAHGTVWLGTYLSGLFRSNDDGQTWAEVTMGLGFSPTVEDIASVGDTLYLAMTDGALESVARSTDGGTSWHFLSGAPEFGRPRALLARPGVVLAGDFRVGLRRSVDGGQTWTTPAGIPTVNTDVGAFLQHDGALWAGVFTLTDTAARGVYCSTDGGATWARVASDLTTNLPFEDLAVHEGVWLAALGRQGFRRSTDGGATWTAATGLPATYEAHDILSTPGLLLLGTDRGVFRSDDAGASWTLASTGAVGVSVIDDIMVEGDVLWQILHDFNGGGSGMGLFRSSDGGATWERRMGAMTSGSTPTGLARHRGALYTAWNAGGRTPYRSTDEGVTWTLTAATAGSQEAMLDVFADGDVALYAASNLALFRSTDAGQTWVRHANVGWPTSLVRVGAALYVGSYDQGVYRSLDDGATWAPFGTGLPPSTFGKVNALALHHGALYAAMQGGGVYRLDGAVWTPTAMANGFFDTLLSVRDVLVVTGYGRDGTQPVFVTANDGATWLPFGQGMSETQAAAVAATATHLLVGGNGFGVWARPLTDLPLATATPPSPETGGLTLAVFPNPASSNRPLRLAFTLPEQGRVHLAVYDALGRRVAQAAEGEMGAGSHETVLAAGLAPGVYVARLESVGATHSVRFVISR